jgi:small subunit ribosomal protein S16
MLVIRLTRVGKKKQPSYRIVVQDKHKDPWGKAIDIVGHYNPRSTPKTIVLKTDRIKEWISKGAQPSPTVNNLLVDAKIVTSEKQTAAGGAGKSGAKAKEEAKPAA